MAEILLLGKGISNNALHQFMNKYLIEHDYLSLEEVNNFKYNLVIKGPGLYYSNYIIQKFMELQVMIITDIEFIYWFLNKEFIGITGTNGKTSTTLLLTEMIKKKYRAIACGNCGFPISQAALDYKMFQYFVIELSSFQLKGCLKFTPKIAIVTNLKQAHLDYHGCVQDYYESKFQITKNQTKSDCLILNFDCENTMSLFKNSLASKITFSLKNRNADYYFIKDNLYHKKEKLFNCKGKMITDKYNILAAVAAAKILDIPNKAIKQTIKEFKGVKYRLEEIKRDIFNDAKSTNIYSTIIALKELKTDILLICGGFDRKEDLSILDDYLNSISCVFAYGATKDKLYNHFKRKKIEVYIFDTLRQATLAALNLRTNEKILYSPMFASYDQYLSFEERGKEFNNIINSYYK